MQEIPPFWPVWFTKDFDLFFLSGTDGRDISMRGRFIIGMVDATNQNVGYCNLTDLQFAKFLECSRQTANRLVKKLVADGYVKKEIDRAACPDAPRFLKIAEGFSLPWHEDPESPPNYNTLQVKDLPKTEG
jgi:hypothetical protein